MKKRLDKGKQQGISKQVDKNGKLYWYSYAVQKINGIYIVYECEIAEENMAAEVYEYENVTKYSSFDEVKENFVEKYGITFADVGPLKGQYLFNPKFYL